MNNVTNKYVIVLTYNIDVLRFMRRIELLTMFDNRENEDFLFGDSRGHVRSTKSRIRLMYLNITLYIIVI